MNFLVLEYNVCKGVSDSQYWQVKSSIFLQKESYHRASFFKISSHSYVLKVTWRSREKTALFPCSLSPCPFHRSWQKTPNYSSINCSGGSWDADSDSFVDLECRAPRSHHTVMIFAKSEAELDSYQQLFSERLLSVLHFLKCSALYSWLPLLFPSTINFRETKRNQQWENLSAMHGISKSISIANKQLNDKHLKARLITVDLDMLWGLQTNAESIMISSQNTHTQNSPCT